MDRVSLKHILVTMTDDTLFSFLLVRLKLVVGLGLGLEGLGLVGRLE